MSFITDTLDHGEVITYQARVHPLAYIVPLAFLLTLFMPGRLTGLLSTELALTGKRVVGRVGMFRRQIIVWPHGRIDIVTVQQGILGSLFNYGRVTFLSKDGTKIKFNGIANPMALRERTDELMEMALLGRVLPRGEEIMMTPVVKPTPRLEAATPAIQPAAPVIQAAAPQAKSFGRRAKSDDTVW